VLSNATFSVVTVDSTRYSSVLTGPTFGTLSMFSQVKSSLQFFISWKSFDWVFLLSEPSSKNLLEDMLIIFIN